jgi:hypothetical protein
MGVAHAPDVSSLPLTAAPTATRAAKSDCERHRRICRVQRLSGLRRARTRSTACVKGEHCSRVCVPPPFRRSRLESTQPGVRLRSPRRPRSSGSDLLTGLAESSRGRSLIWTERDL